MATLEAYGKNIVGSYGTVDSLISDKYNSSATYNTGDYCIYNNALYKCKSDNVTGTWNANKWDLTNVDTELTSINSDLSELEKNNFPAQGSSEIIQLAGDTTFTAPCDGYINVVASSTASSLVYIMGANGSTPGNSAFVTLVASPGSPVVNQNSTFIRKGMKIRTQGNNIGAGITFMPLK